MSKIELFITNSTMFYLVTVSFWKIKHYLIRWLRVGDGEAEREKKMLKASKWSWRMQFFNLVHTN